MGEVVPFPQRPNPGEISPELIGRNKGLVIDRSDFLPHFLPEQAPESIHDNESRFANIVRNSLANLRKTSGKNNEESTRPNLRLVK